MIDKILVAISRRGYRWYLSVKIVKALLLPVAFVAWVGYVIASVALIPLIHGAVELVRVVLAIPYDFHAHFIRHNWLRGFSRAHYRSLSQYKAAPVPLNRADCRGDE